MINLNSQYNSVSHIYFCLVIDQWGISIGNIVSSEEVSSGKCPLGGNVLELIKELYYGGSPLTNFSSIYGLL